MAEFKLVIFDCDGVLVDSERIGNQIFSDMLNALGLPSTLEDMFEHFVGHSMSYCMERVAERLGALPPADFVDVYRARVAVAFASELHAVVGIEAALDQIVVPCCVASNGDHDKMRTTLGITRMLSRFEGKLFSATEVARGKPWPDVYLHAARSCGVRPDKCVVVEDSPIGVAAAVAAGMTVLGYAALTPARRLLSAGAHHVFIDMAELPSLVNAGAAIRRSN
jgi:HAD superfamily hydrolase (TIGR01509 family)